MDTIKLELLDRMRRIILSLFLCAFVCSVYYKLIFENSKTNPGKKKKSLKWFSLMFMNLIRIFNIKNVKKN